MDHEHDEPGQAATTNPTRARGRPLVLTKADLGMKGGSGKGGTSSGRSGRLQDVERRLSKAVHRVTRASSQGVGEYIDARDKSADEHEDGPIVDLYENVAKGVSVAISEASPALVDVAEAFNTKVTQRQIRRILRSLPRLPIIG